MEQISKDALAKMIVRLPDWLRHDLNAKDYAVRTLAEETLAAMIIGALDHGESAPG